MKTLLHHFFSKFFLIFFLHKKPYLKEALTLGAMITGLEESVISSVLSGWSKKKRHQLSKNTENNQGSDSSQSKTKGNDKQSNLGSLSNSDSDSHSDSHSNSDSDSDSHSDSHSNSDSDSDSHSSSD